MKETDPRPCSCLEKLGKPGQIIRQALFGEKRFAQEYWGKDESKHVSKKQTVS